MRYKTLFLTIASVIFIVTGFVFVRSRGQGRPPLKAATMQIRLYRLYPDGSVEEKGTKTVYQSADGSYGWTLRDVAGRITQRIVADSRYNAVFIIDKDNAVKILSSIGRAVADLPQDYKSMPGYAGETTAFGEIAYIERGTKETNGGNSEATRIPSLKVPVKFVNFNDDGSQSIEEAVSILWGEPPQDRVRLSPKLKVTETDAIEKKLKKDRPE
jgi:hypothetical protein